METTTCNSEDEPMATNEMIRLREWELILERGIIRRLRCAQMIGEHGDEWYTGMNVLFMLDVPL